MKILHVETGMHLYGGAQQVAYLLEGLSRHGVDNILVCPPGAAIGRHFAAHPTVKVIELPCTGDLDFGFIGRLHRVLRDESPQLVHLHSRRGADVLGAWAARRAGIPCVLSRRVDNPEHPLWVRLKYRLYARVIGISEGIVAVLRSEGVAQEKLRVVRSAVDAEPWTHPQTRAAFCAEFGVRPDRLLVGVAAQLIERKGHRVLLQALRDLPDRERLDVLFFGQGPRRPALEAEIAAMQLGDRVRFAGFRKDLPQWMGCLDLLVHPAYMEGLGVSLLQASAAGVPIIASRAGGMPEAVRDGINGLLVPPGDVVALRGALRRLIDEPALREKLAAGGRALIAAEFSPETMVQGNLQVYRELLSATRSR